MALRVLELFAGIGACSKALKKLGVDYEIVDAVEIDKYAIKSFNAIHNTNFEPQDIREYDKDIDVDFIMHGSPCQDFSTAGLGLGGDEGSGTRSSLLYESIRIIEKLQPKYVIWENVKNLLSRKHEHIWHDYEERLAKLGYETSYAVMNAKDFGVPQNRERVFTVSIKKPLSKPFYFPYPLPLEKRLKDILEQDVDEKYYLSEERLEKIMIWQERQIKNKSGFRFYVYSDDDIARAITTKDNRPAMTTYVKVVTANKTGYMKGYIGDSLDYQYPSSKTRRGRIKHGISHTLTASNICNGVIEKDYRIRRLTPKECWRLMGFEDSDYEKASKVCSSTQLYKQAGNSIVVDILYLILKNML